MYFNIINRLLQKRKRRNRDQNSDCKANLYKNLFAFKGLKTSSLWHRTKWRPASSRLFLLVTTGILQEEFVCWSPIGRHICSWCYVACLKRPRISQLLLVAVLNFSNIRYLVYLSQVRMKIIWPIQKIQNQIRYVTLKLLKEPLITIIQGHLKRDILEKVPVYTSLTLGCDSLSLRCWLQM